ncbi:Uncharacterised protein [Mycobacteroides abscessus subsp. abscessus]|nr:Uncharacterised protein [Mycobacteroides abscessus subsp. abscessus]
MPSTSARYMPAMTTVAIASPPNPPCPKPKFQPE